MIEKTAAIALRVYPFSNTSHVVVWLTREGEKVSTVVKGAQRPKSAFLGQYDLFYTSELLYYGRDRDGLHIARECCAEKARPNLRHNWRACGCASYFAHLAARTLMPGDRHPGAFPLLSAALDHLNSSGGRLELLHWFELRWLGVIGLAPQLHRCARCRQNLTDRSRNVSWGVEGVVCFRCAADRAKDRQIALRPDTLAILRRWQRQTGIRTVATTQCSAQQLLVLRRIFGTFMVYHMERVPDSRDIAIDLLTVNTGS
jgi:DNA repair protein RecO (recombination protein O)